MWLFISTDIGFALGPEIVCALLTVVMLRRLNAGLQNTRCDSIWQVGRIGLVGENNWSLLESGGFSRGFLRLRPTVRSIHAGLLAMAYRIGVH